MPLMLTPDMGIPLMDAEPISDIHSIFNSAAGTTELLAGYGLEINHTSSSDEEAGKILMSYAEDPEHLQTKLTNKNISALTAATIMQVNSLLTEFSHPVVQQATQIRNLVVNKLLIESDNPDPRIRIKAIELLGKISDVSLFTEKHEVTTTHQTTDSIKDKLRQKLAKIKNPALFEEDISDGEIIEGESSDA